MFLLYYQYKMPENRIASTSASDLTNAMTDFSVDSQSTDGATDQKETRWNHTQEDVTWTDALGYYKDKKTPEITAVIDAGANWTWGKGFDADPETSVILEHAIGMGFDTFNSFGENGERTLSLGGNFYAEIILDDDGELINLKPLDPEVITHIANKEGIIIKFEQTSKIKGNKPRTIFPENMFYLPRNRIADEIHGRGIAGKLKLIIDMKNEAMADQRKAMHWNVIPRWKFKLKTDDPTEIAAYKAKQDAATGKGENIYEPFDVSEGELISVPANATLNPMAWIQYLDDLFYQVGGVPKIIIGGTGGFTEQAVTITYLAFQQNIEKRQLYWEEQIFEQLGLHIKLRKPASVQNNLLSDEQKDGAMNIDASETTAGENI